MRDNASKCSQGQPASNSGDRPVHQPDVFNIEIFNGTSWRGGMNRRTREDAIDMAKSWSSSSGYRSRVFSPEGELVFDTDALVSTSGKNEPAEQAKAVAATPAGQDQRPAIIKERPSGLEYCEAAAHSIAVEASHGTTIRVSGTPYLVITYPVIVDFGALAMSLTEDQAIAFGDALIQVAHRRRAAIAAAKADAQPELPAAQEVPR